MGGGYISLYVILIKWHFPPRPSKYKSRPPTNQGECHACSPARLIHDRLACSSHMSRRKICPKSTPNRRTSRRASEPTPQATSAITATAALRCAAPPSKSRFREAQMVSTHTSERAGTLAAAAAKWQWQRFMRRLFLSRQICSKEVARKMPMGETKPSTNFSEHFPTYRATTTLAAAVESTLDSRPQNGRHEIAIPDPPYHHHHPDGMRPSHG